MADYGRITSPLPDTGDTITADMLNLEFAEIYTAIGSQGIGTTQLEDAAVTAAKLGALAVETSKIAALAVTGAKLNSNIVDDTTIQLTGSELSIKAITSFWSPSTITGADESNGETTRPDGLQIKWGEKSAAGGSTTTVTFTSEGLSAFSNNCFQAFASVGDDTSSSSNAPVTRNISKTKFDIRNTTGGTRLMRWFAIGR